MTYLCLSKCLTHAWRDAYRDVHQTSALVIGWGVGDLLPGDGPSLLYTFSCQLRCFLISAFYVSKARRIITDLKRKVGQAGVGGHCGAPW